MDNYSDNRESISDYIGLWERFKVPRLEPSEYSHPPPPPPKDSIYIVSTSRAQDPKEVNLPRKDSKENSLRPKKSKKATSLPALPQLKTEFPREPASRVPASACSDFTPQSSTSYSSIARSNPFRPSSTESSVVGSVVLTKSATSLPSNPAPPRVRRARSASASRYTPSAHPPPKRALPPVPRLPAHPAIGLGQRQAQTPRRPPTPPDEPEDSIKTGHPQSRHITAQPARGRQLGSGYQVPRSKTPGPSSRVGISAASLISPDGPNVSSKAARMLGIAQPAPLSYHSRTSSNPSTLTPPHSRTPSEHGRSSTSSISSISSYDPTLDATTIWTALKRAKPDTTTLTSTILTASLTPSKLPILREKFYSLYNAPLPTLLATTLTGPYRTALLRLLAGPYESAADWLSSTPDPKIAAEAIFGRQPDEIEQLKTAYAITHPGAALEATVSTIYLTQPQQIGHAYGALLEAASEAFGKALLRVLKADRDYETERTVGALSDAQRAAREESMQRDAERLGRHVDMKYLLDLVVGRSDLYLDGVCSRFRARYGREIVDVVARMGAASSVTYALHYALGGLSKKSRAARDAKLLHDTLGILGVQDARFVARTVGIHFEGAHLARVKAAYKAKYGRDVVERARRELKKGPYRELMVKLLEGDRGGIVG